MSLESRIENQIDGMKQALPQSTQDVLLGAIDQIASSFKHDATLKEGDQFPSFRLPNAVGEEVSRDDLLSKGPILIVFYRGEWCVLCNLAIAAMQERADDFKAKGVTLVAISPQLPNGNLTMAEKHALKFPVLSDQGNKLARQIGIVCQQPDSLRPFMEAQGHDLKKANGDDSFEVPAPAAFLVDEKGFVRNAYVEPDYTKRLEPSVAMEWVTALQG